jgi:Zn-dependent peptidase ImmA (M78 family)
MLKERGERFMPVDMGLMNVAALRKQAGESSAPIDPLKIAGSLDIEVYETRFTSADGKNVSGIVAIEEGQPVIYVNSSDVPARKRFTMAHEIGHVYLGHLTDKENNELIDDEVRLRSSVWNLEEKEANAFAAQLLMPASLIRSAVNAGRASVEELAELFEVSEQAMMYRLQNLGY